MIFQVLHRTDLPASCSPVRVADQDGREIEWANRFLDVQRTRGLQLMSLRSYAYCLLHFVRWWSCQPGVDVHQFLAQQFTESTLLDYVRSQLDEQPSPAPENVNRRSTMLRRLFRFYFQQVMGRPRAWPLRQTNTSAALVSGRSLRRYVCKIRIVSGGERQNAQARAFAGHLKLRFAQ